MTRYMWKKLCIICKEPINRRFKYCSYCYNTHIKSIEAYEEGDE